MNDTTQGTANIDMFGLQHICDPLGCDHTWQGGGKILDWTQLVEQAKAYTTMLNTKPFDATHDYMKDIAIEDIKVEGEKQFVYLRGLEKLAKARGVKSATSNVHPWTDDVVICTFRYEFLDGSIFEGSADASKDNCQGGFGKFRVALAESRAKARALRNAFFIATCSVEEKGTSPEEFVPDTDSGLAESYQLEAIRNLLDTCSLPIENLFKEVSKRKMATLDELTKGEARTAIVYLNKCVNSKKRAIAKTT